MGANDAQQIPVAGLVNAPFPSHTEHVRPVSQTPTLQVLGFFHPNGSCAFCRLKNWFSSLPASGGVVWVAGLTSVILCALAAGVAGTPWLSDMGRAAGNTLIGF